MIVSISFKKLVNNNNIILRPFYWLRHLLYIHNNQFYTVYNIVIRVDRRPPILLEMSCGLSIVNSIFFHHLTISCIYVLHFNMLLVKYNHLHVIACLRHPLGPENPQDN